MSPEATPALGSVLDPGPAPGPARFGMVPLSVLVIDDDLGDRKLVRRLVTAVRADAEVSEAASIEQAGAFRDIAFDAILLDNILPGRTGLECLAALRAGWPRAAIVLMTSCGDETVAKCAIQNGAWDYIAKSALCPTSVERMLTIGVQAARSAWKLQEVHRDLEVFSEVLVHDFRAPARAMAHLSEQLGADLSGGAMEDVRDGVRLLRKTSRQMLDLIASLAEHIRFDHEEQHRAVAPADLVDRALTALASDVAHSGARVRLDLGTAPPLVHCDPPQIAQVLQNLVANAIRYAGAGPPDVTISVCRGEVGGVLFKVSDRGIGVPEAYRERIFEPFRRVPGGASAGTGLGLATCRKIVGRHGGRIWCDASRTEGALFGFLLPRGDAGRTGAAM
ncbi:HAMP domain-containing sensor histidine kinase [Roseibacterium sp. SDUM158017]|uniref:sensor histidine kinase n=1 Tax=Roseicyclus salinarum TaxID=3036773 RepID=UPI0024152507|nr:HAMP domain-containing sensor histidine kinase [Roseibacterium sp. SDUM158017]MDG4647358.1 HAMP domain-containing sensor histidine kinase [Roseibacterium sp. SDUM158017]